MPCAGNSCAEMLAPGAAKSCCAGAANAIKRLLQSSKDLAMREPRFHNLGKPRHPQTRFDNEIVTENTLKPRQQSKKAPKIPNWIVLHLLGKGNNPSALTAKNIRVCT